MDIPFQRSTWRRLTRDGRLSWDAIAEAGQERSDAVAH
jgi:hypothetical protein